MNNNCFTFILCLKFLSSELSLPHLRNHGALTHRIFRRGRSFVIVNRFYWKRNIWQMFSWAGACFCLHLQMSTTHQDAHVHTQCTSLPMINTDLLLNHCTSKKTTKIMWMDIINAFITLRCDWQHRRLADGAHVILLSEYWFSLCYLEHWNTVNILQTGTVRHIMRTLPPLIIMSGQWCWLRD